jgi:trk system potassium uptake protein
MPSITSLKEPRVILILIKFQFSFYLSISDMKRHKPKLSYRERVYRWFFAASDTYRVFVKWVNGLCRFFFLTGLIIFILCLLFYIGFEYSQQTSEGLLVAFRALFLVLFLSKYIPEILQPKKAKVISWIFKIVIFIYSLGVLVANYTVVSHERLFWEPFSGGTPIIIAMLLISISALSELLKLMSTVRISPALIFSSGFLIMILIGSGLLLLPKTHSGQLTFLNSLFTSVSAVCVTGLTVVNTATAFTDLGKIIILCLIQIGGLGIMTFTGFFGYIFTTSGTSLSDRLLLKELFSAESLNNLFSLLLKIILLTFFTEIAGALIIYSSLDWQVSNKIMFSAFHAVSAFCNAGFSVLPEGLYSQAVRSNYAVQITVALLVILGGIGFPVLVGVYSSVKNAIIILIKKVMRSSLPVMSGKKNIPTRIVLITTIILLFAGTGLYYFFENAQSMNGMSDARKIITSFFGSVSARTAGFNVVDISAWSYPTVFLMMILMWIGASPGSTGGGIKTTTFALAIRSAWNSIRGKDQLKLGNREIGSRTLIRILSIIILSIILITTGFFSLLISEPGKNPVHLLFECVSAFGTVGLSLADTATFSKAGKIIIMILMFIGRIGPLTLFTGFMLSNRRRYYKYPELDIIIN